MKLKHIVAFLIALIIAPFVAFARAFAPSGTDALNTVAGTHEKGLVSRFAEVAFASGALLVTKGTADNEVTLCSATTRPLGTTHDKAAIDTAIGIYLLGLGDTQMGIASGAITADAPLYTAASGKVTVTATAGCWLVGYALAPAADGGEVEFLPCVPVQAGVPVLISSTGGTVTAEQAFGNIHVSNLGASAAATFALPAALPGMRVTAIVEVAQELRLDPKGTETIALPSTGVQGAAGKYLTADAVAERVQLVCLTAGTWDVAAHLGTWAAEG